jgi:hypothetical protein
MCEAMINASQATRMTKGVESKYRHIKPFCWEGIPDCEVGEYTSDNARRLTREELMRYLAELRLLERPLAAVD